MAWLFCDSKGRLVLFEFPNVPLLLAIATWISLQILHGNTIHFWLEIVFNLALVVWAILEIFWGNSNFRKLLGSLVLAYIVIGLLRVWLY